VSALRCSRLRDARRLRVQQSHITRAGTLAGVLGVELDTLTFAKQFENGATNGATVEEMFNARFISNEAEALVDEQARNGSRRHTVTSDVPHVVSNDWRPRAAVGSSCEDGWPEDWRVPYALQTILPTCPRQEAQAAVALQWTASLPTRPRGAVAPLLP